MPPTTPAATASAGDMPNSETVPESGWVSPSTMSIVVDLPAPFGPSSATVSPGAIERSMRADGMHIAVGLGQLGKDNSGARSNSVSHAIEADTPENRQVVPRRMTPA